MEYVQSMRGYSEVCNFFASSPIRASIQAMIYFVPIVH